MKRVLSRGRLLYAKAGEKVVNAKGDHICTIAVDIYTDERPDPARHFTDWQVPPIHLGEMVIGRGDWWRDYNDLRFADGWRMDKINREHPPHAGKPAQP